MPPDYELADELLVDSQEQHRALGNLTRYRILSLLLDRAMTASQLAEALGVLKGSVSFHVRVLAGAGLIREVRTRKVRGVVERYYGRTARRFELDRPDSPGTAAPMMMRTIAEELERIGSPLGATDLTVSTRARLDPERAAEFRERLVGLVEEFRDASGTGAAHTLAVAYFRSEP